MIASVCVELSKDKKIQLDDCHQQNCAVYLIRAIVGFS